MSNIKIYACGPINGCHNNECLIWRNELRAGFVDSDYDIVDPLRRDYRGVELENLNEIVTLDKVDIDKCDIIFANCLRPSAGTSMEIMYSFMKNKPIVSLIGVDSPVSPWIKYHSTITVLSISSGINWIKNKIK